MFASKNITFIFFIFGLLLIFNSMNSLIVPNSMCFNKQGCTCSFSLTETEGRSYCVYGDVCLYATIGTYCKSFSQAFECSSASECYCGTFASWKSGNKYCLTGFTNSYTSEIPEDKGYVLSPKIISMTLLLTLMKKSE